MIQRTVIATVFLLSTLSGFAMQQTAAPSPSMRLMLFRGPGANGGPCPPCEQFSRDYGTTPGFANAIRGRFEIVPAWDYRKHAEQFERYDVTSWPTFVIVDRNGRELGRVTGYNGSRDLWRQLSAIRPDVTTDRPPLLQRPLQQPPAGNPDRAAEIEQQFRDAARQMQDERETLEAQLRDLQKDLAKERQRADAIAERSAADNANERAKIREAAEIAERRIEDKTRQLRAEQDRLEEYDRRRARSDPVQNPFGIPPEEPATSGGHSHDEDCEDGVCPIPSILDATTNPLSKPTEPSSQSTEPPASDSGFGWSDVGRLVVAGVTIAAAPPIAIPTGLGLAATVGAWLYRRRRDRQPPPPPPPPPTHQPATGDQPRGDGFPNADNQPGGGRIPAELAGPALPRDNSEIEQILSLRQQEQREPVHDAFFGVLFEDEYRSNPDQSIRDAYTRAMDRFNHAAPLSSRASSAATTTTGN